MTEGCGILQFPDHARGVERCKETDAEIVRRQPVRGLIRRMKRNRLKLLEVKPADTPYEVMSAWVADLADKPTPAELADLAERLRDSLVFEEDGALAGNRIIFAIDGQADRVCDWQAKNKLRFLAGVVDATLRPMGLL